MLARASSTAEDAVEAPCFRISVRDDVAAGWLAQRVLVAGKKQRVHLKKHVGGDGGFVGSSTKRTGAHHATALLGSSRVRTGVKLLHVDVDATGQFAMLAVEAVHRVERGGRLKPTPPTPDDFAFFVLDLERPEAASESQRLDLPLPSAAAPAALRWNPHVSYGSYVACTHGSRALVYNLQSSGDGGRGGAAPSTAGTPRDKSQSSDAEEAKTGAGVGAAGSGGGGGGGGGGRGSNAIALAVSLDCSAPTASAARRRKRRRRQRQAADDGGGRHDGDVGDHGVDDGDGGSGGSINDAIDDADWSPLNPGLMATVSADGKVRSWDLRAPEAPTAVMIPPAAVLARQRNNDLRLQQQFAKQHGFSSSRRQQQAHAFSSVSKLASAAGARGGLGLSGLPGLSAVFGPKTKQQLAAALQGRESVVRLWTGIVRWNKGQGR